MNWERVDDHTERARVKGGWLVRVMTIMTNASNDDVLGPFISVTFIPDTMHGWMLPKPAEPEEPTEEPQE